MSLNLPAEVLDAALTLFFLGGAATGVGNLDVGWFVSVYEDFAVEEDGYWSFNY